MRVLRIVFFPEIRNYYTVQQENLARNCAFCHENSSMQSQLIFANRLISFNIMHEFCGIQIVRFRIYSQN